MRGSNWEHCALKNFLHREKRSREQAGVSLYIMWPLLPVATPVNEDQLPVRTRCGGRLISHRGELGEVKTNQRRHVPHYLLQRSSFKLLKVPSHITFALLFCCVLNAYDTWKENQCS